MTHPDTLQIPRAVVEQALAALDSVSAGAVSLMTVDAARYTLHAALQPQAAAEPVAMKQILQIYIDDVNAGDWHRPQQNYVAGWKAGYKHGAWSTTPPAHTEAMRLALEALKFIKQWGECALAVEKRDTAIAALEGAMK